RDQGHPAHLASVTVRPTVASWARRRGGSQPSFDHLVGGHLQGQRHFEAERLRSVEIDDQLESRGLRDREISWLFALENAAGIDADLTPYIRQAGAVAHQCAGHGIFPLIVNCGNRMPRYERYELMASGEEDRIAANEERVGPVPGDCCERLIEVIFA